MGYGDWLIRRYPQLAAWSSADLQGLIDRAKWQTRLSRVMASAISIQLMFYGALNLLKHTQTGSLAQEAVLLLGILGVSVLICDFIQAAIVKVRLEAMIRCSVALRVIG